MRRLVMLEKRNGWVVPAGTVRKDFRLDEVVVVRATRAELGGREGKVLIRRPGEDLDEGEVYASVVGLRVTELPNRVTADSVRSSFAVRFGTFLAEKLEVTTLWDEVAGLVNETPVELNVGEIAAMAWGVARERGWLKDA